MSKEDIIDSLREELADGSAWDFEELAKLVACTLDVHSDEVKQTIEELLEEGDMCCVVPPHNAVGAAMHVWWVGAGETSSDD